MSSLNVSSTQAACACDSHLVQFYRNDKFLAGAVSEYARLGLAQGDAVIVIATAAHLASIRKQLMEVCPEFKNFEDEGSWVGHDADVLLPALFTGGRPDREKFWSFVSGQIGRLANRHRKVRIYGELVNLLCEQKRSADAVELEGYWNEFLHEHPEVSLMCGYGIANVDDGANPGGYDEICRTHSEVIPPEDVAQFLDEDTLYRRIAVLELRAAVYRTESKDREKVHEELKENRRMLAEIGKLSVLGEIASGLAHELNNPLAIVQGSLGHLLDYSRQLPESESTELLDRPLQRIAKATERMVKIVRGVLAFSRNQEGDRKPFVMTAVVGQALDLLRDPLTSAQVKVEQDLGTDDLVALGDENQIVQVLMNIILNAKDAIAETGGSRPGKILIRAQSLPNSELELTVSDNGAGMPNATCAKVFHPFFTTKGPGKGTGMGLSLSYGIIKSHRGRISVTSEVGKGTQFRIVLPKQEIYATRSA